MKATGCISSWERGCSPAVDAEVSPTPALQTLWVCLSQVHGKGSIFHQSSLQNELGQMDRRKVSSSCFMAFYTCKDSSHNTVKWKTNLILLVENKYSNCQQLHPAPRVQVGNIFLFMVAGLVSCREHVCVSACSGSTDFGGSCFRLTLLEIQLSSSNPCRCGARRNFLKLLWLCLCHFCAGYQLRDPATEAGFILWLHTPTSPTALACCRFIDT